jgi:hypothetical protein
MANSQIPMVNIWDDHDIMDGFGSYPDSTMECPVFAGVGAVAFKYYMLFQHQTVPDETEADEPSWLLGARRGPYIHQLSRSVFMSMGPQVIFLGLDCRTERQRDEILDEDSWERVFDRLERDVVKGQTKHLLVQLGIPIAYPRLNFLENILTSRVMDPLKMLGRTGMLGGFVNKFDGGVEILDDLDDHWTAKHHKDERNWFVQELQRVAATKSVRITFLSGDVHLAAIGQFFSNPTLGIPKDRDHRYMPNVISSAIVNSPPGDMLADVLNKRNKVHHLDEFTDENMIGVFHTDVDGKPRNNKTLLPRRNWCSIRDYAPTDDTPLPSRTPSPEPPAAALHEGTGESLAPRRSLSLTRRDFTPRGIARRFSKSNAAPAPPMAFYNRPSDHRRTTSADAILHRPTTGSDGGSFPDKGGSAPPPPGRRSFSAGDHGAGGQEVRPNRFVRRPTDLSEKALRLDEERAGVINLAGGLDIRINVENDRGDPAGTTTDYGLIVPALDFDGPVPDLPEPPLRKRKGLLTRLGLRGTSRSGGDSASISGSERGDHNQAPTDDRASSPLGGWIDDNNKNPPAEPPTTSLLSQSLSRKPVPQPAAATAAAAGGGPPSSNQSQHRPAPPRPDRSFDSAHNDNNHLFVPRARRDNNYPVPTSASPTRRPAASGPATAAAAAARGSLPTIAVDTNLRHASASGRPAVAARHQRHYPDDDGGSDPSSSSVEGTRGRIFDRLDRLDRLDNRGERQRWSSGGAAAGGRERERDGEGTFAYGAAPGSRDRDRYVDPGSPTQKAREKRKSSWRFWRVMSTGDR